MRNHATLTQEARISPVFRDGPEASRDREQDAFTGYLGRIGRHELLTADMEVALATELRTRKAAYWIALLSERAVVAALAALPEGTLEAGAWSALVAARDPSLAELADALVESDPDMRLADRLAAELEHLAAGEAETRRRARLVARDAVAHDLRPTLARIRAAAAAVRRTRERFVAANLRLVVKMAMKYRRSGLPVPDLVQEGNLGLMKAVDRFDHRRGFRFSTYATWWIKHSLSRAVAKHDRTIRVPVGVRQTHHRIVRVSGRLQTELGRPATDEELATALSQTEASISRARAAMIAPISMEAPIARSEGGDLLLRDRIPDADAHAFTEKMDDEGAQVREALTSLPPLEAAILRQRFGLDSGEEQTLREIGETHGLSRERIRQLEQRALRKLRRVLVAADR